MNAWEKTALSGLEEKLDRLDGKLDRAFEGDPNAGHPGIFTRVDRLERFVLAFVWVLGFVATAVVGLVVKAIEAAWLQ